MSSAWAPRGALPSGLLYIADAGREPELSLRVDVARAERAGLSFIELRRTRVAARGWGSAALLQEVEDCLAAAPRATILVNDRVDLALASCAHGAHVGQDDLPAVEARQLLGEGRLLGLSTHDEEQFRAAAELPLDYLALGPIFASSTKSGHAEPVGLELLARCRSLTPLPVVAIGGIDAQNARSVLEAGASCLALVGALAGEKMEEGSQLLLELTGG